MFGEIWPMVAIKTLGPASKPNEYLKTRRKENRAKSGGGGRVGEWRGVAGETTETMAAAVAAGEGEKSVSIKV